MNANADILYAMPTWALIPIMLALIFLAIAFGVWRGKARVHAVTATEKAQVSMMQTSLMGLLALLVGFSFSMALGRFNDRSQALVEEANAIGTAWLRTDLETGANRDALRTALADYAAARQEEGRYDVAHANARGETISRSQAAFAAAWATASTAARVTPNPSTAAVVSSLNDMIDAFSAHEASLTRHVPAIVLILQFGVLAFLGWTFGYASGEAGERPPPPMLVMIALIVLLLAMILDLDRPRRGLIEVDQSPLISATAQILAEAGRSAP